MRHSRSADARTGAWLPRALLLAAIVLAGGCGLLEEQQPGSLGIRHAQLARGATPRLDLALECRLSGPMQDALEVSQRLRQTRYGLGLTRGLQ